MSEPEAIPTVDEAVSGDTDRALYMAELEGIDGQIIIVAESMAMAVAYLQFTCNVDEHPIASVERMYNTSLLIAPTMEEMKQSAEAAVAMGEAASETLQ